MRYRWAKEQQDMKKAKRFLMVSIFMNVGILAFFKYADFIIGSINGAFGTGIPLLRITLHIGISF